MNGVVGYFCYYAIKLDKMIYHKSSIFSSKFSTFQQFKTK